MTRSYTPESLVAIPTLTAAQLYALCRGLLAVAHARRLTALVGETLTQLEHDADALHEDLVIAATRPGTDAESARAAHHRLANAWGALADWCSGWVKLPAAANPHAAAIAKTQAALFADGLSFTLLGFKAEWSESDARMHAIEHQGHKATITALGGEAFLTELRAAHRADGEALDLTRAHTAAPSAHTQPHMDAVRDSLREYVTQVAATVRRSRPGSAAVADLLLAPLSSLDTATSTPAKPPVAPATPPTA